MDLPQHTLDCIAKNLTDIGAISFEDYLAHEQPQPLSPQVPASTSEQPGDVSAVSQLHQACQRTLRNTDALKFEFIEHSDSRNKQCILTITKPDGIRRSYATQPIFAKKNEAKLEVAKIAIDMGALEFLAGELRTETSSANNGALSDSVSLQSTASHETFVDIIEKCCLEWRAGRVTSHWVPFSDSKLLHKQGCALRIQLSPHVVRVYLADPTFDAYLDAKVACAKIAVCEGVLDFIKYGNGQTRPSSPIPSATSLPPPPETAITPWTLQAFYESLPRPFPESFEINEASEINAPGWLNTIVQNARGGKLILSFFFTSDGPPGLHGCLLKLDRPGEYKASLVDARFPKRSDAKAAVCLQAISEGIGEYVRSITSAINAKITHTMRSFSSNLVYPALMSELSKIQTDLHPHFEYEKERDAFGATLVARLSTSPMSGQVRRYTVPSDYRNKADAKVGVVCHAAEQGVVEFVRFRGGAPPDGYVSPYTLQTYNPDASRKRKQLEFAEDSEQGRPAKKKKKRGKRRADGEGSRLASVGHSLSIHPSSDQMHSISGPGDMGLLQSVHAGGLRDPSQPGVGGGGGSGAARPAVYGHRASYNSQMYALSYPASLDPRFAGSGGLDNRAYNVYPLRGAYGRSHPTHAVNIPPSEGGPSHARPGGALPAPRWPVEPAELEPGEVVSSAESEFSESSSRNEDGEVPANERDTDADGKGIRSESVDVEHVSPEGKDKGKGKETSPANTSTTVSRDGPGATTTITSYVKKLMDYCAQHCCGTPSFHETQQQGRFQVWIVVGKERFDLPATYGSVEEGRQRVAKQVLARLSKGVSR